MTRDLAYSRLLPVRQSIGQFLSAYEPTLLAADLRRVAVVHAGPLAAEGRVLLAWLRRRLTACGAAADDQVVFATVPLPEGRAGSLAVRFDYGDPARYFRWSGDLPSAHALFEADLGTGATRLSAAVSLLPPEVALSEAMFF